MTYERLFEELEKSLIRDDRITDLTVVGILKDKVDKDLAELNFLKDKISEEGDSSPDLTEQTNELNQIF